MAGLMRSSANAEVTIQLVERIPDPALPAQTQAVRTVVLSFQEAPNYICVFHAIPNLDIRCLPTSFLELLDVIHQQTGVSYFWIPEFHDERATSPALDAILRVAERTIVWLGEPKDDSDTALRCLERIGNRTSSRPLRRPWSRREGQAMLALSERSVWKHPLLAYALASQPDFEVTCGRSNITWQSIEGFRQFLQRLAEDGRIEHHAFATNILESSAGITLQAVYERRQSAHWPIACLGDQAFPPPIMVPSSTDASWNDVDALASAFDASIASVEQRWNILNVNLTRSPSCLSQDVDLDAEIQRYTQLLAEMDVLDADLQQLDAFGSCIRSVHREFISPRASPEIPP